MTQYNPNPNGTSSTAGWSSSPDDTFTGSVTLTATADGLRIVKPAGRAAYVATPEFTSPVSFQPVLAGWKIRRNTADSGGIVKVSLSARDIAAQHSSTDYDPPKFWTSAEGVLDHFAAPGVMVTMPNWLYLSKSGDSMLEPIYDATQLYLYFGPGPVDITLTSARIYRYTDSDIPANVVLDASDAAPSFTFVDNSLSVSYSHAGTADEGVDTLALDCPAVLVTDAKTGVTAPLAGTTVKANNSGSTDTPGVIKFPAAGVYLLRSSVRWAQATPYPQPAYTSGAVYSVTVPTGPFLAGFNSLINYLDLAVDSVASTFPSNDPPSSWTWSWGDGTPDSTGYQQTHTYAAAGTYAVKLTMASAATLRSATVTRTVTAVAPPAPGNYFTPIRDLLSVTFSPSITAGTSYAWSFGDGTTSTDKIPVHVYAAAGAYSVTLTVNGTQTVTQTVVVYAERRPLRLAEVLSLEVALPWAAGTAYNRLPNPSGDQGAWGWITPLVGSYVTGSATANGPDDHGVPGPKLVFHSSGASTQTWYSQSVPVTAGQYASAQIVVPYLEGYFRMAVEAFSSAGALLGSSTTLAYTNATTVQRTAPYLLPVGTVSARVRLYFYASASTAVPPAGAVMQYRRAMLATAATSAELTAAPFRDDVVWQNIIGPTARLEINRAALNLGTLTGTVMDSSYDPAKSGVLRPGQRIRLRAVTEDAAGIVTQDYLFSGKIQTATSSYNPKRAENDPKSTTVTLSATDATTPLTQTAAPNGVALLSELPAVLEAAGVPYEINGQSGQIPSASTVSVNPNASVLDQVAVTRDSTGSYAYVSRAGVLVALDPQHMIPSPVGIVAEQAYSSLDAKFSTASVINSVMVSWLRYTPASGDKAATVVAVPYGPYEDAASIATWGRQTTSKPFTMQGFAESATTIQAKAAAILAANKTPVPMITSAVLPIRYTEDVVRSKALLDLYDAVALRYARTGTDILARVTSIKHSITPSRWSMTLGFAPNGATAAPQLVAAPPSTSAASAVGSTTPSKAAVQVVASTDLLTNTTPADVPGCSTSVTVTDIAQRFLVTAHVALQVNTSNAVVTVVLSVNGTDQAVKLTGMGPPGVGALPVMASQTWLVSGLAAGARTFKLTASSTGTNAQRIVAGNTTLTVVEL